MAKQEKKKQLSNRDVAFIVEREGLSYAICDYIGSENFKDQELARLWTQARDILNQITDRLPDLY